PMLRHICLAGLLLTSACASSQLEALEAGERPAEKSGFEAGMWAQMDKAEADISRSGFVVKDEALNGYVNEIVCTLSKEYCSDIRLYILRDPSFGAAMAPNGMALVNTGLILRASDEAELAHVLAHEIGHYVERHSAERYASLKNGAQFSGFVTGGLADLFVVGSVLAFSREQEYDADRLGFDMAVASGYEPSSAAGIWANLKQEIEASKDRRKKRQFKSRSWLSTHPVPEARQLRLEAMAAERPAGDTNRERFYTETQPHLLDWLSDEISQRDIEATLALIDRIETQRGQSGLLNYARAEGYRVRSEENDKEMAFKAYKAATDFDDSPAEAWRQLGDFYYSNGQPELASAAFTTYLEKAPDASDRALIQGLIIHSKGEEE
ncbi:MAG: M48 family metallopeptidase, partial [Pseudomonadota bacterium]